jgi:uncharacterized protein
VITGLHAQKYPKSTGFVNDFANLLTHEQGAALNKELIDFEKKTTIEIAVVTVPWLNNQSIEDYTRGLAEEWGVGKGGQDNGVVFLIAPKEHKMRIETASGVSSILTDSQADKIRDNIIIPNFKAGNMPQGIIEATHEIMHVLDTDSAPATTEKENSRVPADSWTAKDTQAVEYALLGMAFVALLLFLIVPPIYRAKARKYVLENKEAMAIKFAKADEIAKNSDVEEKSRKKFEDMKSEFALIYQLTATSKEAHWLDVREKLDSMEYPLSRVVQEMNQDIAYAYEARKKGPALLKKIPSMIEAAEKKLAKGKASSEAMKYLEEAKAQYAQVQSKQSEMTLTDWVFMYMLLTNIEANTANAETAHQYTNTDHSSYSSSSSSSDSNSSYGFGDSGGFSGGGGFDGGGSSGSW